jgi:hypothetical protein
MRFPFPIHASATPCSAGPCVLPNLIAQTEGRVGPRFRLPSVDRRHGSSVGRDAFFRAFVPAAKALLGVLIL